jgi:hypothetical protein
VVSLKQAQAMEEQFEKQNNQTGIQQHHDNSTESVPAGQVAKNQGNYQQASAQQNIKQSNVQSGQTHFQQVQGQGQQAQSQSEIQAQENQQTIQSSIDEKAKAKAKTQKDK